MKKLLQTLTLILMTQVVSAQFPCQAAFNYYYDGTSLLYLNDASYNTDSTLINVQQWYWTVQYGGAMYTYNSNNPIVQVGNYTGPVYTCLTINTNNGIPCTSTFCDSIYLNNVPLTCNADFIYYQNGMLNNFQFTDFSVAGPPAATVNSWSWVITDSLQNTLFTSNMQNPSFTFPGNGFYDVCLTIYTDSGCSDTQCYYIILQDSIPNNCQLNVSSIISDVTIIGGNDGYIDLAVSGGTPPYTFNWSNGAAIEDIFGLTSGVYTVSIDQSGGICPTTYYTFTINEPYNGNPIDTLWSTPIDTCLNFQPDSFWVSDISVQDSMVTVTWVFIGGGIIDTFTVSYIFSYYGNYIVSITINCAKTTVTYMTHINIASYLGIENESQGELRIYPNPFTGSFNLNLPPGLSGANIQIYNYTGQIVYNVKTHVTDNSIDANQWHDGVYFVRVLNGQDQIMTSKIIKQ